MQTGDRNEAILVVEDDSLMRQSTSEALHEFGYTVFDSDNAANALAILDREPKVKRRTQSVRAVCSMPA